MINPENAMAQAGVALHYLSLAELSARLRTGTLTPEAVTLAQLQRIQALDGELRSYAHVTADLAMAQARQAQAEIAAGHYRGPLHGVPLGLKDLCLRAGVPVAAGAPAHRAIVAGRDATVVRRLREAGAILLGQLQMTEGAYSDHHPDVKPPRNPWHADYWTGISSSGPAVATAAGLCFGAVGSDTGGSIRWPCAATGLTGIKPTWGRVSRHGIVELAASLDHVGPMARDARDAALLLQAMAGADPDDPTALTAPVPDYLRAVTPDLRGVRIGVDAQWNSIGVDTDTRQMLAAAQQTLCELGAQLRPVQFPDVTQAISDWAPHCAVEAAVAHAATYPAQRHEYGPVLAGVIEAGHALSGIDYQHIRLRRMALRGRVDALFAGIDVLLTPVQPYAPLTLATVRTLGQQPALIAGLQRYTCPFDLTGHPTLTMPGGWSGQGLPMGLQLVAAHLDEAALVRTAVTFQSASAWHLRRPAL